MSFACVCETGAASIEDIYRETPAERTQLRQARLLNGIAWFLQEDQPG